MMSATSKIRSLEQLASEVAHLRSGGKRIVHCHGIFDLLHIGHIRHLERARQMGDLLVVTVAPDRYVEHPQRASFPEQLRAEGVAALNCVDYVAINKWPLAIEPIALLRPHLYVKAAEFQNPERDLHASIRLEAAAVEAAGGRLAFTDELTQSSPGLPDGDMSAPPDDSRSFLADYGARHRPAEVIDYLDRMRGLRVLVVGEAIIDEYQYCQAIGKSSKAPALVARVEKSERFAGGILAVANHIADFCGQVSLLAQLGTRSTHEALIREQLHANVSPYFLHRRNAPTIVKRRFIESYFFTNMLELYEINDGSLDADDGEALCTAIQRLAPEEFDLVVVVDYGHNMLTAEAAQLLSARSRFLAMNAQANAGNRGHNRVSKYPRADYVCAAEYEMELEARDWHGDLHPVVLDVAERLSCTHVTVTRGGRGALCYGREEGFQQVPALGSKVIDRVGAGDTFLAISAPALALGAPIETAGFLGNVAAAEAVATVGHREYLRRARLEKHVRVLLA